MKKHLLAFLCTIFCVVLVNAQSAPDSPMAKLNGKLGGHISKSDMRATKYLETIADCSVSSYTLHYFGNKSKEVLETKVKGAAFSEDALKAVQKAEAGDQYIFVDVRLICKGDTAPRVANSLAFMIK